jgi:hypothetical protein
VHPPENGRAGVPRPRLNTLDATDESRSDGILAEVADRADVVDMAAWLLAHGRWTAWEAERSTWAPEWAATRDACTGICTCWGAPLGGQP